MSEFLAEAVVNVLADTKKFLAEFNKVVAQAEKTKVNILVQPDFKGFRAALQTGVTNSQKGVTAKVLVRPDMTGFRTALQAAVLRSSKGVVADVTVRAGSVTKGAAAAATGGVTTGGVVDKRTAEAQLAVNKAVDAGVASRRRIIDAMSDEEKFATRLAREQLFLKTSTEAVNKAVIAGVPALLELAEKQQRAAQTAVALSEAQQLRRTLNVPIGVSTADFTTVAAAERAFAEQWVADHKRMIKMSLAQSEAIDTNAAKDAAANKKFLADQKAKVTSINAELAALKKRATAIQLSPAVSGKTRARDVLGQPIIGGPQDIGAEAVERNQALNESAKAAKHIETELASARRTGVAALQVTTDVEKQLAGTRGALRTATNAVLLAEENYVTALATEIPTVIALRDAELSRARALAAGLAATTAGLEVEATRAGFFTASRRAIVAQIANLTGLRGAALTAATGFIAASAAFIAFRKAVGLAAELETELAVFKVTAGATADQMEEVHERAIELGRDITLPGVSAHDAAEALGELSKAGLSVEDSMEGARGVLQLATAANIDNAQATTLAASALNAFGLEGREAAHVADVLANSANQSQGSIVDAGVALQQSSAVARQAGISLEETVAALTLFARAGLRGSDAGTSLRTALIRLINPSTKAAALIEKLGLRIRDSQGNIDLSVFDQFTKRTEKFSAAARDQALAIIFGQDAIRGAAILAREGATGLNAQLEAINKQGTASVVASARTSGFAGSIENLKNQLSDAAEEFGAVFLPGLTDITNALATMIADVRDTTIAVGDLAQQAEKPIDIVVNFIRRTVGGDEGDGEPGTGGDVPRRESVQGRIRAIFSPKESGIELVKDFNELGIEAFAAFEDGLDKRGIGLLEFPTLTQARTQVRELIAEFNKDPAKHLALNDLVTDLIKMQEQMAKGTTGTKDFAKTLVPFIAELQELDATNPTIEIEFPKQLLAGARGKFEQSGKEAAFFTSEAYAQGFISSMKEIGKLGGKAVAEGLIDPGVAGAIQASALAVTQAANQSLGAGRARTQAKIRDDVPGEIAAIQRDAAAQRKIIAEINKISGGDPVGDALKRRTKAEGDLESDLEDIKNLREGQTAKIKQDAADAKKARDDADQSILDALAPATRRLDTAALIAGGTKPLQDNINVAKRQIQDNQHQIAVILKQFHDREAAGKLVADLRDKNIQLNQQITADTQGLFDATTEAFDVKLQAAQTSGNLDRAISLTKNRIEKINEMIRLGRVEGAALRKAVEERNQRRLELQQLTDDRLEARTAFAQSVFDLTGNKNPLLAALTAQINNAEKNARKFKQGSVQWLRFKTAANNFRKQREAALEEATKGMDGKKGTTAFDLMAEFNARFGEIAGNLVTPDQPFAGGSEFTDSIVNKAISGFKGPPHRPIDLRLRGEQTTVQKQINVTEELIGAIRENTEAQRGGGNRSTATRDALFTPTNPGWGAAKKAREERDG